MLLSNQFKNKFADAFAYIVCAMAFTGFQWFMENGLMSYLAHGQDVLALCVDRHASQIVERFVQVHVPMKVSSEYN